jgi:uncharacterized Zn-binding protein involved in type VI secretion
MNPLIICEGDITSHGGTVLEGFPDLSIDGRPVAGFGHKVSCPQCDGIFPIAESSPIMSCHGVGIAFDGMRTACGAILLVSP